MESQSNQLTTPELLEFIDSAYGNMATVKHQQMDNSQRKMDSFLAATTPTCIIDQPSANGQLQNTTKQGETRMSYLPTESRSPVAGPNQTLANVVSSLPDIQDTPTNPDKKRKTKSPLAVLTDEEGDVGIASVVECMASMKSDIADQIKQGNSQVTVLLEALRKDVGEIHSALDRQDKSLEDLQNENVVLQKRNAINEGRITRLEKKAHDTHEELLRIQQRSMRDNLIFQNIPETPQEVIQKTLLDFMSQELKISPTLINKVQIVRSHRMGEKGRHSRPIVAQLNEDGKSIILSHTKHLKGKNISVFVQMPRELSERKKQLIPRFRDAKSKNISTKWLGDKLQIGNSILQVKKDTVNDINLDTTHRATEIKVGRSPPIVHEGNSFQGSAIRIKSPDDIIPGLHAIYADSRVARATHNIYAYRLVTQESTVEHFEDDGEFGAGRRIMELLRQNNVENTLVCVTRWYGGKHLGPVRFDKIIQCAKTLLGLQ